jgi:hypothetical protein
MGLNLDVIVSMKKMIVRNGINVNGIPINEFVLIMSIIVLHKNANRRIHFVN